VTPVTADLVSDKAISTRRFCAARSGMSSPAALRSSTNRSREPAPRVESSAGSAPSPTNAMRIAPARTDASRSR